MVLKEKVKFNQQNINKNRHQQMLINEMEEI